MCNNSSIFFQWTKQKQLHGALPSMESAYKTN